MTIRRSAPASARRRLATVAVLVALGAGACASSDTTSTGTSAAPAAGDSPTTAAPTTTVPPTTTTIDPGTLEQTRDKPDATSAEFKAGADALWQAIVTDDPEIALPFFFPKSAYLQVKDAKAVGNDPAGDWERRLVGAFRREIHDYHQRLGANAGAATLVRVDVPEKTGAAWMGPGTEYNRLGYWRVLNSKIIYTVNGGKEQSLPITSMISWRGRWYVVHLAKI